MRRRHTRFEQHDKDLRTCKIHMSDRFFFFSFFQLGGCFGPPILATRRFKIQPDLGQLQFGPCLFKDYLKEPVCGVNFLFGEPLPQSCT